MNTAAWEKRLLLHLPYGVIGLAAAKLSEAWRLSAGTDFSAKFLHLRDGVAMAFRNGLSGFVPLDLLIGFLCGCALCLLVHAKRRNADCFCAQATREHNDANVLALGGRVVGPGLAIKIVETFLDTPFSNDERHIRRIKLIEEPTDGE